MTRDRNTGALPHQEMVCMPPSKKYAFTLTPTVFRNEDRPGDSYPSDGGDFPGSPLISAFFDSFFFMKGKIAKLEYSA